MGRKSIFEQLAGKMNFLSEIRRIDKLLKDKSGVSIKVFPSNFSLYQDSQFVDMGIESFVDMYIFKLWKD